jgi:hypothetical protein
LDRWTLDAADGGDRARTAAFLDRLEAMTRAEWLEVGRRTVACASNAPHDAAVATLAGLLEARRLGVTAWLVRDAVTTAVQSSAPAWAAVPRSAGEATLLAAGCEAAALAALALLARPWLRREELAALLTPFGVVRDD